MGGASRQDHACGGSESFFFSPCGWDLVQGTKPNGHSRNELLGLRNELLKGDAGGFCGTVGVLMRLRWQLRAAFASLWHFVESRVDMIRVRSQKRKHAGGGMSKHRPENWS